MVQFDQDFATALVLWTFYAVYNIAHRDPWSLWTTAQRRWYLDTRKRLGWGPHPTFEGIWRLIVYPLVGLGQAWYHVTFQPCNTDLYPATIVVAILALSAEKIRHVFVWDRRNGNAAFWVIMILQIPLYTAWIVLVSLTNVCIGDGWTRWYLVSIIGLLIVYSLYYAYGMWIWSNDPQKIVGNISQFKQRRRLDIQSVFPAAGFRLNI